MSDPPRELTVQFSCLFQGRTGPASCGIVVFDHRSARSIHEAGYYLGDLPSHQAAMFSALLKALEVAMPLNPASLDLRCSNELLVRQLTGAAAVGRDDEVDLYEQSLAALLRLDTWQIGLIDPTENQRAAELAQRAMGEAGEVAELDAETASRLHERRHTGVPQWTVELLEDPGAQCPARCEAGRAYAFGPDTPAGLCVHAALVALTDGPLVWTDPEQRQMTSLCPRCEVALRLRLVD